MADDDAFLSIAELGAGFRNGSRSPVAVTRLMLDRIARLDLVLNSFITVSAKEALGQAAAAERDLKAGHDRGPLHGVPIAIKDLIDVEGLPTTFASNAGSPRMAHEDAPLVGNLRAAGAVILGKTNLLEYAYGAVHPDFGQTNNPWDAKRTSGGSSGGSAAAVAAGLCFAAVGTDTGGSIRIPAAYCGAVGLKPSYGSVDLGGVQALSPSLDHAGPIARSCADAAFLLGGMTGKAFRSPPAKLKGLRVGIMSHPGAARFMQKPVQALFDGAVDLLRGGGAIVQSAELEAIELAPEAVVKIVEPEASQIHRALLEREPERFSAVTRAQIEAGFSVSEADYRAAGQFQKVLQERFRRLFATLDVIISPSVPWVAPAEDPPMGGDEGWGEMLYSGVYNLVGLPALSIPCGLTVERLPAGLQIVAPWQADDLALGVGAALEALLPRLGKPAVS